MGYFGLARATASAMITAESMKLTETNSRLQRVKAKLLTWKRFGESQTRARWMGLDVDAARQAVRQETEERLGNIRDAIDTAKTYSGLPMPIPYPVIREGRMVGTTIAWDTLPEIVPRARICMEHGLSIALVQKKDVDKFESMLVRVKKFNLVATVAMVIDYALAIIEGRVPFETLFVVPIVALAVLVNNGMKRTFSELLGTYPAEQMLEEYETAKQTILTELARIEAELSRVREK